MVVYLADARKAYLNGEGHVDWSKVQAKWDELKKVKVSLANKYFKEAVRTKAESLPQEDQQRLLDIMMGGLENNDSSVGAYATRPEDYDIFAFYLEPLIREYHGIEGDTKQQHDWNIPVGKYLLTKIDPKLEKVSMRARVARNVAGWNLPPKMDKEERLKFEAKMVEIFEKDFFPGKYHSLTPGHKNFTDKKEADELIAKHYLFNDMTTDNHLTSSGVASDWPHGRGIWVSDDETKMIWIGEEDQLRIISIVKGTDLGAVDKSLHDLLSKIEASGLKFAEHPTYGIITTCPTNMGTGKRQSILGQFPHISEKGTNEKKLKELAKTFGLQARGMGGQHSAMDKQGTADISPSARFGVTEAFVTNKLYQGLIKLYEIQKGAGSGSESHGAAHGAGQCVYLADCRKKYLDGQGHVDWNKVEAKWAELKKGKVSLGNKYFTPEIKEKAKTLSQEDQQRLLDVMMGGLQNGDSSVGVYATSPEDYDKFAFYLEKLIRQYHGIEGDTKQLHDWNIPVGKYLLTNIDPKLEKVSMRARVARNVVGFNLPPKMDKDERLKFEAKMVDIFEKGFFPGQYHSLTPGHKNFTEKKAADKLIEKHFLFNDMTTDNHLTSSGVASDWPHGRGIWVSDDETKMIWIGEEDQLRIISIVKGTDLGAVDKSLHDLLSKIEASGLKFAEHPVYGVITTCPTNMGTGKRQSILGQFPNISKQGTDEAKLKTMAKCIGLQARGMGGQHSAMDKQGTADVSPSARFGVTEAFVTEKLYAGLVDLYQAERGHGNIVFLQDCRKKYLDSHGNVDWSKVEGKWSFWKNVKQSLGNKFFTKEVKDKAKSLSQPDQQRLLDVMMGGLENGDSSVGVYATSPEDYDKFSFYLQKLIRAYHGIQGDTKQQHDWNIPVGEYLLTKIDPKLQQVSMRARVARNVVGFNLPPKMDKDERLKFEAKMVDIFEKDFLPGKYHSLTPGHKNFTEKKAADKLIEKHFLFNDMTTDNHLTSSGVASDWPHGRGIWVSDDETKMIWIGEEDQLRIISIVKGTDLGAVDKSLHDLLSKIEASGLKFAEHPTYGVITTCPTNMGTGKRQSILGQFPNITKNGKDQKALKDIAKEHGLQARGMGGEHSSMDSDGTADISPSARFGVTQAVVSKRLYEGLQKLYDIEKNTESTSSCSLI